MSRPSLQVCVATGQNLANLIPALQLQATEVVILETPEMREGAGNLKRVFESRGIAVKRVPFDDSTPESVLKSAERVACDFGERPLVFNATGGHKLMTLALAEQMNMADNLHLVYSETRYDRLDWLKPTPEMEPMKDVLSLNDILLAQGYRRVSDGTRDVQWQADAEARSALTRRLGEESDKLDRFFGALNKLADQALNELEGPFHPQQELEFSPGGRNAEVLNDGQRLGLLHWDKEVEIVFRSPDAARYFRGGWLEEYVWLKLRGLKPRDWASNIEIETANGKTRNQFDALLVHRNRLLVIECKTTRIGRDADKDSNYIYKLAQLSRSVGGIMSRSLLLSARPVSAELRQRAADNGVDVLAASEVKDLVRHLRGWMDPA